MFNLIDEALNIMRDNLDQEDDIINLVKAEQIESEINNYRNQLKVEHGLKLADIAHIAIDMQEFV